MIGFLLEKEFKYILRDSMIPKILVILPLMMMLVYPFAANQEIKELKLSVVDNSKSTYSIRLINKLKSSGYFILSNVSNTNNEAMANIEADESDIILELEQGFEKNLINTGTANLMISANSVNGMKGGLGTNYLSIIIRDFARELGKDSGVVSSLNSFEIVPQYKFNPHLDYKIFMLPAIMVILVTMLGGFLPALNIVGEKEKGTIEQMNVTPVSKWAFIISKLVPYWIICYLSLTVCFILAALVYDLVPAGGYLRIYLSSGLYILVVSGLGLVISNYSDTMQQAMFVMFFLVMVFILMSGLFTPINSMPGWAQTITYLNPLRYFIQMMRMIYLKGSSLADLLPQIGALLAFTGVFNIWAVFSYKKTN